MNTQIIHKYKIGVKAMAKNRKTLTTIFAMLILTTIAFLPTIKAEPLTCYNGLITEPSNPVMIPTENWEGGALCEQSDFKLENGTYIRWYRGGDVYGKQHIGVATSQDGVNWQRHHDNPIIFPGIPLGYTNFPFVVKYENGFYAFVTDVQSQNSMYLYNITEFTRPKIMNSGLPVFKCSQQWEGYYVYNMGVWIEGKTWHMIYESTPGLFNMGYSYSTLDEMNWTAHKSSLNPIFKMAGNPYPVIVPERNAVLLFYGTLTAHTMDPPIWSILTAHANIGADYGNPDNWKIGKVVVNTTYYEADPHLLIEFSEKYPLMLSWGTRQVDISQGYSNLNLTEFFDEVALGYVPLQQTPQPTLTPTQTPTTTLTPSITPTPPYTTNPTTTPILTTPNPTISPNPTNTPLPTNTPTIITHPTQILQTPQLNISTDPQKSPTTEPQQQKQTNQTELYPYIALFTGIIIGATPSTILYYKKGKQKT